MLLQTKEVPAPSRDLLFHPEKDALYQFFQDANQAAGQNAFRPSATAFEPVNAWWLADASLLAYRDGPPGRAAFAAAGLPADGCDFLANGSTQCHLAGDDRFTIVAFRGTQPDEPDLGVGRWGDIFDDATYDPVAIGGGREVHRGFQNGLDRVWDQLLPKLQRRCQPEGHCCWFTGHSLGAALATLAADRFPGTCGIYTFGSPRVGNSAFARAFDSRFAGRSFRYVNADDLVTSVPPDGFLGYEHVGRGKHLTADGQVVDETPPAHDQTAAGALFRFAPSAGILAGAADHLATFVQQRLSEARREWNRLRAGGDPSFLPLNLVDHTPRRYAVGTWNAYVGS